MWSDTGSFIYDSRGDVKTYHDPEKKCSFGPETIPHRYFSNDTQSFK